MSRSPLAPLWPLLDWGARLLVGGLFCYAGVMKLRDPVGFANEIANYHLVPELAPYAAASLPTVEVVLGAALIAGPRPWRRAAALVLCALLALFTVAVAQAVLRGINVDCGCFGTSSGPVSTWTVIRDLLLLVAAALPLAIPPPRPAPAAG